MTVYVRVSYVDLSVRRMYVHVHRMSIYIRYIIHCMSMRNDGNAELKRSRSFRPSYIHDPALCRPVHPFSRSSPFDYYFQIISSFFRLESCRANILLHLARHTLLYSPLRFFPLVIQLTLTLHPILLLLLLLHPITSFNLPPLLAFH